MTGQPSHGGLRLRLVVALVALAVGSAACTPLYVPPVPTPVEVREPVAIGSESFLEVQGDGLVAHVEVRSVDVSGWLSLQWYGPSLAQAASDSVWIEASADPTRLRIALPDHVMLEPGRWRLVLGFEGAVVRQLDAAVTEDGS